MAAIVIVMGIILIVLPAIAAGWHYRSLNRAFIIAFGAILGPAIVVLLLNVVIQLLHPTDEVGWKFVAAGLGGPAGWVAGVFGPALAFARRDRNLRPSGS